MKQKNLMAWMACAAILACGLLTAHAQDQEKKMSDEQRGLYIKNFHRIGLNTTTGDAMFLRILVESGKSKRGIEVGTSTGFGAINMGLAFERNGGQLFTLDIDPEAVKTARGHLEQMGLSKVVTVIEGDALKTLPALEGEFDFIFIDALKQDYLKYLQAVLPKLKPGALIVADNVIKSAKQMQDYLEYVKNEAEFDTVIIQASLDKGDGMAVSYKRK